MMKAVYDLEHWQPSYCIVILLMAAEHERIKRGEEFIDLEIVPGTVNGFGKFKHWPNTLEACVQWRDEIVMPMSKMLPSVKLLRCPTARIAPDGSEFSLGPHFGFAQYVEAYAAGIRPLRPLKAREPDPKLITITLRECGGIHWQQRDSNLSEWCVAARVLVKRGYRVVIVRDTRMADKPLPGLTCSEGASIDLRERAMLYSQAACNMFVSNGPVWFALALDVPVLMFRPACDTANKNSHSESMAKFGIRKGEQMIGAPDHQRLVWNTEDRADIIVDECLKFMAARA